MFLLDDLALSPIKGFLWIARELEAAAERARGDERERLTRELRSLYMKLETGRIEEAEFDKLETDLLDALDALEGESEPEDADDEADEDEDEDEEDDDVDEDDDEEEGVQ